MLARCGLPRIAVPGFTRGLALSGPERHQRTKKWQKVRSSQLPTEANTLLRQALTGSLTAPTPPLDVPIVGEANAIGRPRKLRKLKKANAEDVGAAEHR